MLLARHGSSQESNYDLRSPVDQQKLSISFISNFKNSKPKSAITAGDIFDVAADQIGDFNVAALFTTQGSIAGNKVATFCPSEFDNDTVDGLIGLIAARIFSKGIQDSQAHISVDWCNMRFVEADFSTVVKSDAINDEPTDLGILAALTGCRPLTETPDLRQPAQGRSNIRGLIKTAENVALIEKLNNFLFQISNENGGFLAEGLIKDVDKPIYRVRHLRHQLSERGKTLQAADQHSLGNMDASRT